MSNTFGVGTVVNAQIRRALRDNPEIGSAWPMMNPLAFECNDGYLNDIQAMGIDGTHYDLALCSAAATFKQGAVGAGRGMSCFSFKGGMSASRLADMPLYAPYTVGALVLANFGRLPNLTATGRPFCHRLAQQISTASAAENAATTPEKGSIILVIATDAPLDAR